MVTKARFECRQALGVTRVAFAACGEHVRDFFVTMNVQKQVYAVCVHLLKRKKHFGANVRIGVLPRPVQVLTVGIGSQVAVKRTVRVHVRDQVQVCNVQQLAQLRVAALLKTFEDALHEPFGHVLARVLLGDDPNFTFMGSAGAFAQQFNVAAFNTFTGGQQFAARPLEGIFDQQVMALAAVRLEVGKPDARVFSFKADV